jgi:hypothetical protein
MKLSKKKLTNLIKEAISSNVKARIISRVRRASNSNYQSYQSKSMPFVGYKSQKTILQVEIEARLARVVQKLKQILVAIGPKTDQFERPDYYNYAAIIVDNYFADHLRRRFPSHDHNYLWEESCYHVLNYLINDNEVISFLVDFVRQEDEN